jgi:hypothetical protein
MASMVAAGVLIVDNGLLKQTGKYSSCELGAALLFVCSKRRGKNLLPAEDDLSLFLNSIKLHSAIIALMMQRLSLFATGKPFLRGVKRRF